MGKTYNITVDGQNRVGGDDYNTRIDYATIGSTKAVRQAPVTAIVTASTYVVLETDRYLIFNGSGTITVTLPTASSWSGREIFMKTIAVQTVVSAASDVKPATADTAGTAILAAADGANCLMVSDGTDWVVMQTS